MNFESEELVKWLSLSDQIRADANYKWLVSHFAHADILRKDLLEKPVVYKQILKQEISSSKAVESFAEMLLEAKRKGHPIDDPGLIYNESALLAVLLQAAEECHSPEGTLSAIETTHELLLRQYLNLVSEQADALCKYLLQINRVFNRMSLGHSRVILTDLPVGNSLPVLLLDYVLSAFAKTEIIRVALTRNDSRSLGITREQLLANEMNRLGLGKNDMVVHFDEWDSGANFNRICKIQKRILKRTGTFFFAAAVLTAHSQREERFRSFCDSHDETLAILGLNGADYRRVLPPLRTLLKADGYFFWSENDRMAGYRKMQVHGSMFSTIDETIKLLHNNGDELHKALCIALAVAAGLKDLPESILKGLAALKALFEEGYQDYINCRGDLERCADEYSIYDGPLDLDGEFIKLSPNYKKILDNRKAGIAVNISITYARRLGSIDPANRYYFKSHAPMISKLEGRMAVVHRVTVDFLKSRIQNLQNGIGTNST